MDIDVYRNFLTVVSCGTISGAARQLNMTQPALSMQMKTLQANLGEELLIKSQGSHKLELTAAGELVYQRAEEMIRLEDELQAELVDSMEGLSGTLQIGVFTWADKFVVEEMIPDFHKLYPKVRFSIYRVDASSLQSSANQCDLRVIHKQELASYKDKFDVIFQNDVGIFVAMRKDNPWFGPDVDNITVSMLNKIPMAVFNTPMGKSILNHMYAEGLEPDILLQSNYRKGVLKAAESGMTLALVFSNMDEREYPKLKYIPLMEEHLQYIYVVGKPKGIKLSPILQRFNEFIAEFFRKKAMEN